ncbi:hypothetical protein L1987_08427 [Smallanthus sonchifolius]|uniref:Uncharacterized protein n=1 Tax=Smallanthus sonchifolius TaxID=185202 RepID=A0ACB9JL54_9ASTR|nr:hypothetical protein L1987_08427 [Smallanthus sonchifolius]
MKSARCGSIWPMTFGIVDGIKLLQKSAPKPMQTPQGYASAASYGSPSLMYIGLPPYGSSLLNESTVPPYDVVTVAMALFYSAYVSHEITRETAATCQ